MISPKNDKLDILSICDVLSVSNRNKSYRIDKIDFYKQHQLTRHHHNLKKELNVYMNGLQKFIDIGFIEFNNLFKSKSI